MQLSRFIIHLLLLSLALILVLPSGGLAEDNSTQQNTDTETGSGSTGSGLLYNGSISPAGTVTVTAESGDEYKIKGNTPIGMLEALRSEGRISSYAVGDELVKKKGILTLDGINDRSSGNESGWYVKVNGERLEDFLLPDSMSLNRFVLREGDVVLYILGDPRQMVSDSPAYLSVMMGPVKEVSNAGNVTANTTREEIEPEEQPDDAGEVSPAPEPAESGTSGSSSDTSATETTEKQSPKDISGQKGNESLFSGSFSLSSGMVNLTTSGGDYEIDGATPLGLLNSLLQDGKISSLDISDRAMRKGGILVLEGINNYPNTADKIWFVEVNGVILKDYENPDTDGLNKFRLKTGDTIGFYFGEPAKPVADAEASMIIDLE